jgi:hypothetical protein
MGTQFPQVSYVLRQVGLELRIADKNNDRMDVSRAERQKRLYGLRMLEVLAERILKATLVAVENLCPLRRHGIAENPPRVILGLNHEHAVPGYDNVVDLGGPPRRGKRDVVKNLVFARRQSAVEYGIDSSFASRTFDSRGPKVGPDSKQNDDEY